MTLAPPLTKARRYALRQLAAFQPLWLADQLRVLNAQPQGAAQIDSQVYPDDCDPTHPFHFDFYLASDVLKVNYLRLSFFLRAFRSNNTFSTVNTAASTGHSHNHSHSHSHGTHLHSQSTTSVATGPATAGTAHTHTEDSSAFSTTASATPSTDATGDASGESGHTHGVSMNSVLGVFEGAVATGVTVKVNGTDRTAALGGGTGFTTNQTELLIPVAWLNPIGQWNTVDLTPSGLGRITGHLTVVSYIQSG
jgi:hypothetical protein